MSTSPPPDPDPPFKAEGRHGVPRLPAEDLRAEGYLLEANRRFFHPLGLALAVGEDGTIEVLDDRLDPEGWRFAELDEGDVEKVANVARLEEARRPDRERALGYWIQPAETMTEAG